MGKRIEQFNSKSMKIFSSLILMLAIVGIAAAATPATWIGGSGLWSVGANWDAGLPTFDNFVWIDSGAVTLNTTAVGYEVYLGNGGFASLNMTSGSLTTTWALILSLSGDATSICDISGGDINLGSILWLGDSGTATVNMSDGTVATGGDITMGAWPPANGTFNLSGGDVTVGNTLTVGRDGSATLNLSGGTITCNALSINSSSLIDITNDGTLIINGNVVDDINTHVANNRIIAYGGSNTVDVDYNQTNPGKTTVTTGSLCPPPGQATNPNPPNSAIDVNTTAELSWTAGDGATSHDVYFGATSPPDFQGNQSETTFDPCYMAPNTTHYWRIDEVNDCSTTTGAVWTFTTGCPLGDLDGDCAVDWQDLLIFTKQWLDTGGCSDPNCADLYVDNIVNLLDFSLLAGNWDKSCATLLIAHFEGADYGEGWQVTGTAFGTGPAQGTLPNQNEVTGYLGNGLVNSFLNGDSSTGTLTSPEFTIERPYINFLIGGGYHPSQTRIDLLVNDQVVRTATGESINSYDTEHLSWDSWNLHDLQGYTARIQIVDQYTGNWGHISIDHIEQSCEWKKVTYANAAISRAMHAMQSAIPTAESDPMRPVYHFRAPAQWMNDLNGPVYYNGYYHIFYQFHPFSETWTSRMYWGHARSTDMVHWQHLPIALWPSNELGEEGCFSGGSIIDNNGKPMLFYTSIDHPIQQQWAATPVDDNLIAWAKHPDNPVLTTAANGGVNYTNWRDPSIFIDNGIYYMIVGGSLNNDHAAISIYRAQNDALTQWEYLGTFYEDPTCWNTECPNFFKIDDKWVLLRDTAGRVGSYVGTFDNQNFTFTPESEDFLDHSWQFYASNFVRDPNGRIIVMAWVKGFAPGDWGLGWGSCLSLPRVLSLRSDNTLRVDPLPELQMLRQEHHSESGIQLNSSPHTVTAIEGTTLEVIAEFEPGDADVFGLKLLHNGSVVMTIGYDGQQLNVNGTTAPLVLGGGENLTFHVYVDKSLVEVYLNDGRVCLTRVIWPYYSGQLRIQAFADNGTATLQTLDIWQINPIW